MVNKQKNRESLAINLKIITIVALLGIIFYTLGFGINLWKEKQKIGAMAVFILTLTLIILPFFSVLRIL